MTYPKLQAATPLDRFRLLLRYSENEQRLYDFSPNLAHAYYKKLADEFLFRQVTVEDGELFWATGQDFCPHTLYDNSIPYVDKMEVSP